MSARLDLSRIRELATIAEAFHDASIDGPDLILDGGRIVGLYADGDAWVDLAVQAGSGLISQLCNEVEALRGLVGRFTDDDECDYDHHGYCQTHSLGEKPCEHEVARALIDEWRRADSGGEQTP